MIIPKLHYITQGDSPKQILENVQKACTSGTELVQLRYKNVSEKKFLKLAEEVIKITSHFQTRLIINDHYKVAKTIKADGVHLGPSDVSPTIARKHLYTWQSIGGTANTLQDCEALIAQDVDYISLGPFRFTDTKSELGPILGLEGYTAIMDELNTTTPVVGVGGINTADIEAILKTGISGVAVSTEITKNFDSIKTFNQLLKASVIAEQRHTFE